MTGGRPPLPPEPDERSGGPRHAAIAAALRRQIRLGELTPGSSLPSEARLTERYGVSRGTIRQALATLRAEGVIVGGRGRAPVVARAGLTQSFDELISFSAWAEGMGHRPSARTLELARRPADAETAQQLDLEPGTPVFHYKRVRLLDGEPAMVELTTIIDRVGRLLVDCDMETASIYEQLLDRGVELAEASQSITARAASSEQAALLGIRRRAPVLEVRRRVLDPHGVALEWSRDTYRGDVLVITIQNRLALPRSGVAWRLGRG